MNLRDLERLKAQGLIRDFTDPNRQNMSNKGVQNMSKKGQKIKGWIGKNLWAFCRAHGWELKTECVFHPERKWRADWYFENEAGTLRCMVEYEGLMSEKSRHTTRAGYTGDADKYNEAAKMGIVVLRLTALNYRDLNRHLDQIVNKSISKK